MDERGRLCFIMLGLPTASLCLVYLTFCSAPRPAPPIERLATDVHVSIGRHALTLPFAALEDFAYRGASFSLDRTGERKQAKDAADSLLLRAADRENPLVLSDLSIVVRTYGWNDFDMRQRAMCPLLTREWARAVCDNPWAAVQQALPANRFSLVDLSQFSLSGAKPSLDCPAGIDPLVPLPKMAGEAAIVCRGEVVSTRDVAFHDAVVRIDGDLGAAWTVWSHGQNGETAEAMVQREGEAIVSFVEDALGKQERFQDLQETMCRLRRPGSRDGPDGPDCPAKHAP